MVSVGRTAIWRFAMKYIAGLTAIGCLGFVLKQTWWLVKP